MTRDFGNLSVLIAHNPRIAAMSSSSLPITELLLNLQDGDRCSANKLMPLVYDDFRAVAARQLAGERRHYTLQPTELVHEAYLKLTNQAQVRWKNRVHFLAVGAQVIRRIIIDCARTRGRAKRGGKMARVDLHEAIALSPRRDDDVSTLREALKQLAVLAPRQARIVELRFFGGMTMEEVAVAIGCSTRTAGGEWAMARAWLLREIKRSGDTKSIQVVEKSVRLETKQ
jgi:RNA polymerase sigma-70 factor (ECF subfamily)